MGFRGEQIIKGTTYVFEAVAQWDSEKQQSRQKRIYIGKKDPVTGAFLPNKKYYELYGEDADITDFQTGFVMKSVDFGNIYLMDQAASACGLKHALEETFPDCWEDILVCAMHSCSENEALYLCEGWAHNSRVPLAPSSQSISKLLKRLDEDRRMQFYKRWAGIRGEKEYLALDISSVSSWSELINYVEYGYNRNHEDLPQVNLAMLFGEDSRLPVFSRIYPGSIKDVSTLVGMVSFMEQLQRKQMHFVMDKGFYSAKGVGALLEKNIKFAIGVPFSTGMAKEAVRENAVVEKSFDNIKNDLDLERLRIHSDKAMEGRIFIGFVSLIITSYIRRIMEEKNLYSSYSLNELYSELKKLRLIQFKNGKQILTELTSKHKAIFKAFNVKEPVPSSL